MALDLLARRLDLENPWWANDSWPDRAPERSFPERLHFAQLVRLTKPTGPKRAVIVQGLRRIGKTVLLRQLVRRLLVRAELPPREVLFASLDGPVFAVHSLEEIAGGGRTAAGGRLPRYVLFDEIQYVRDWERQLKVLVDAHPTTRFVCSGSAMAAPATGPGAESGAGRFTYLHLPPLLFGEFLRLTGRWADAHQHSGWIEPSAHAPLNRHWLGYLNIGGFPEAALHPDVAADPGRFLRGDIIDAVLHRDLPTLYGVRNLRGLAEFFTHLAVHTGDECSIDALCKQSGHAKDTIYAFLDYLERAFLIRRLVRVQPSGKRFLRDRQFKVHLTTTALRSALIGPVGERDADVGHVVESAFVSQWFPINRPIAYARGSKGEREVDLVVCDRRHRPEYAIEVKWSDGVVGRRDDVTQPTAFCRDAGLDSLMVTTRTRQEDVERDGVRILFRPAAREAAGVYAQGLSPAGVAATYLR
jgi:hypothetical protein